MKLLGLLKDEVDKAETKEEKKNIIAQAGMELTDDELENVVGGVDPRQDFIDKSRENSRKKFQQQHQADKEKNKQQQTLNRLFRKLF